MKRIVNVLGVTLALYCGSAHSACSIAVTPLNFGAYDVFATAPLRSIGTFTVNCNATPPPTVTISLGPSAVSGVIYPRRMRQSGGSDALNYNLFINAALSQVWGDGISGGNTLSQIVTKSRPWYALVYGSLPAQQNVSAGSYNDTLLVTIIW